MDAALFAKSAPMISPDVALALLVNRTALAYGNDAPAYMTYREQTHVSAPALGRTQDINRDVAVRVADDYAVMQDLPRGAQRTGQAFPIIPYFNPFSAFSFSYYANLKKIDITLQRGQSVYFTLPAPDSGASAVVPYNSYWYPVYAADSTPKKLHFDISPTPRETGTDLYPSEVVEDPATALPAKIVMSAVDNSETIALEFSVLQGHWVITHGTFTASEHVGILNFQVIADVTFDQFQFYSAPPDSQLAPSPSPSPSQSPTSTPS